ncbi:hypothetical protein A2U01_0027470, partial [Trifolium medium]|nr:hypothetical protein [Trifolium medium]
MAENTRMKELSAEVKKNAESVERSHAELHAKIAKLEEANQTRFDRMETIQKTNEAQFNQLNSALAQLLHRLQATPSSHHGGSNSGKETHRNPFQVRTVKLDFPRFDGKNVMDWIFKAEQFFEYYDTPDIDRLIIASVHLDHE